MSETSKSSTDKLFKAIWNRSLKGVQSAVDEGADINAMHPDWGTALYICSQFNHSRIARFLLSCPGIDILKGQLSIYPQGVAGCYYPLTREEHNTSPLYAAIIADNTSIARMILAHPDKDKYLGDKENWKSIIKGAFNHYTSPVTLSVLLDAAKVYPKLFKLTVAEMKRNADFWRRDISEIEDLIK